jgi:signal transduction histidine kinase
MKLFTKYNRINLIVMSFLFLITGVIYYVLISKVLVDEVDEALWKYEMRVKKYVDKNDALPVFKNFEEVLIKYRVTDHMHDKKIRQVELYNIDDRITETFRQIVFTQQVGNKIYEVSIAKPLEGTKLLIRTIAYSTLAILLLIIIVSVLLNYLLLRKLWQPFYAAMKELKGFKLGNKRDPLLPVSDIDEFSLMNQSLSKAINSAKDDYRILKEFTENASHETQTPLAIIRSKLDLVIQDEGLSEGQTEALKSAYAAVSRLSKLNQSLLLLAKIENQQFTSLETIDLKERIEEKLHQFHEFWQATHISVKTTLSPANIYANAELIDILLNNLLSNAGRHNIQGGEIHIDLIPGKLEIANTAKSNGLDNVKIFSRFYKEAQHSRHNGLGLSIVKQICDHSDLDISYDFHSGQHHFIFRWKV